MLRMRALPAGFIAPCLPTKTDKLPSGGQWLHEIKHDGFRIIARKTGAHVGTMVSVVGVNGYAPGIRDRSGCDPLRHSRRVGVGIERCALYATDNQESEPRGIKKSPFSLCDCLCSGILPLERADSARTKLWCKLSGGLHHAEDSNCAGCILGDAERCRCCRPASQGAAASGACSGWQVSGRQGSDWQISTSSASARRDQGLTVCSLTLERLSGLDTHPITTLMPRFGGAFLVDWNRDVEEARRSRGLWSLRSSGQ